MSESISKEEAINAMEQGGYKVAHDLFSPNEYIWRGYCEEDGTNIYIDEQGYQIQAAEFWKYRQSPDWNVGWHIVG